MQLLEYQAKELLKNAGAPVPTGTLIDARRPIDEVRLPVVVKSQVPVGGRGKLGGIRLANSASELNDAINTIAALDIKGYVPNTLLLEEAIDIERELYLALRINRDLRRVEWLASRGGGVEIESNAEQVVTLPFRAESSGETLSQVLGVEVEKLMTFLTSLERCFFDNDLVLLEINPLVITSSDELVCADAKAVVDDNSRFRHDNFDWPEPEHIKPLGGTIGVIANGAGMAMSTMDTIFAAGARPANFLDIGGGTGEDVFVKNLKDITELPGVTSIIVNIFAGITRCDDIARGIIAAKKQIPGLVPLFIRLEGTNRDEAAALLKDTGIELQPSLKSCIDLALELEGPIKRVTLGGAAPTSEEISDFSEGGADRGAGPAGSDLRGDSERIFDDGSGHLFNSPRVIVQGITGHHGAFHTQQMLQAGTNIVAGVTPGKDGEFVHDVPVYNTVKETVDKHHATASVIFVPAKFAKAAMLEAIDAGIKLIVCITEGIPVHDMLAVHDVAARAGVTLVGPNCPGLIVPGSHKLGIIASHITSPGRTTIISRSGTLTYELADALTKKGIGERLILGIGGDPVQGMTFVEALAIAENDSETNQIILVGEIGGESENLAANYIAEHITKPVYGLVVGHSLPAGQTFGHAGAIVGSKGESAAEKTAYMASRGINMSQTLDELIASLH